MAIHAGYKRVDYDHFHPQDADDPSAERKRRGRLEQIDFTAFACNREVIGKSLGRAGPEAFQAMAVACAQARAAWVAEGLRQAQSRTVPDAVAIDRLAGLRRAYDEYCAVYEAARRMVERGYIAYEAAPPR